MTTLRRINQDDLRNHNLSVVISTLLRAAEPMSRAELAKQTGLTKVTMSLLVSMLVDNGVVREGTPSVQSSYGRPSTPLLIAYALIPLSCGIPAISAFLLIQRTFYAFEDGLHPFLAAVLQYGFTTALMIVGMLVLPPNQWIVGIACSVSAGVLLALPFMLFMLRKRFGGSLEGKPVVQTYGKALAAAVIGGVVVWLAKTPVADLFGASIQETGGQMSWLSALGICIVLTLVLAVVYIGVLWALRATQLTDAVHSITVRFRRKPANTSVDEPQSEEDNNTAASIMPEADGIQASPTARMSAMTNADHMEPDEQMKPQLGDTILNHYETATRRHDSQPIHLGIIVA